MCRCGQPAFVASTIAKNGRCLIFLSAMNFRRVLRHASTSFFAASFGVSASVRRMVSVRKTVGAPRIVCATSWRCRTGWQSGHVQDRQRSMVASRPVARYLTKLEEPQYIGCRTEEVKGRAIREDRSAFCLSNRSLSSATKSWRHSEPASAVGDLASTMGIAGLPHDALLTISRMCGLARRRASPRKSRCLPE